jgi:hypothetical protein
MFGMMQRMVRTQDAGLGAVYSIFLMTNHREKTRRMVAAGD